MKPLRIAGVPDVIIHDLAQRFWKYDAPQPGFKYSNADDATLDALGLPNTSFAPAETGLRARLAELLDDVRFEATTYSVEGKPIVPRPVGNMVVHGGPGPSGNDIAFGGDESSGNWAGRYVTPRDGRHLALITARWKVPDIEIPPGALEDEVCAASVWIGIDGQRSYLNSSLPQIGTWHSIVRDAERRTTVDNHFWWQWYVYGFQFPAVKMSLPAEAGDEVAAILHCGTSDQAVFVAINRTRKVANVSCMCVAPTVVSRSDGTRVNLQISGATAQWIFEKPSTYPDETPHRLPLVTSGNIGFEECWAVEAGRGLPPVVRNLDGSRSILMRELDVSREPARMRIAADVGPPERETHAQLTRFYVRTN